MDQCAGEETVVSAAVVNLIGIIDNEFYMFEYLFTAQSADKLIA
jgi:hypothetical protein